MNYYTADNHFSHQNIIKYTNRPFDSYKGMNASMISRWNGVVKEDDIVYVLGDVFLGNHPDELKGILKRLNGTKILILGNHDLLTPWQYVECGFQSVHTYLQVMLSNNKKAHLMHDPAPSICFPEDVVLVGHVHNLFLKIKNVINVGVDQWNLTPVSEKLIIELLNGEI